jgi:hypothetical protein
VETEEGDDLVRRPDEAAPIVPVVETIHEAVAMVLTVEDLQGARGLPEAAVGGKIYFLSAVIFSTFTRSQDILAIWCILHCRYPSL